MRERERGREKEAEERTLKCRTSLDQQTSRIFSISTGKTKASRFPGGVPPDESSSIPPSITLDLRDLSYHQELAIYIQVTSVGTFQKLLLIASDTFSNDMKTSIICLLFLMAVAYVAAAPQDKYTNKFDNIDVDQILQSDRLLTNYYKCLMDQGRCTPDGNELKRVLPEALATQCKKCSDLQRELTKKVIKFLANNKPEMWENLLQKYDPEKKYRAQFEGEAKKIGVKV